MEDGGYDRYTVKVDGTGRITLRNRRFLRKFTPATTTVSTITTLTHSEPTIVSQPTANQQNNYNHTRIPKVSTDKTRPDTSQPQELASDLSTVESGNSPPSSDIPAPEPRRISTRGRAPRKNYVPETGLWE